MEHNNEGEHQDSDVTEEKVAAEMPEESTDSEVSEEPKAQESLKGADDQRKNLFITLCIIGIGVIVAVGIYARNTDSNVLSFLSFEREPAVATVNGEDIGEKLFNARFAQAEIEYTQRGINLEEGTTRNTLMEDVRNTLIDEELLYQKAQEDDITLAPGRFDEVYGSIRSQFTSDDEYNAELAAQDITDTEFRRVLERQLILEAFVTQYTDFANIEVTEAEIEEFYSAFQTINANGTEEVPTLEEARPQIIAAVRNQKVSEGIRSLVEELRAEADIETHELEEN